MTSVEPCAWSGGEGGEQVKAEVVDAGEGSASGPEILFAEDTFSFPMHYWIAVLARQSSGMLGILPAEGTEELVVCVFDVEKHLRSASRCASWHHPRRRGESACMGNIPINAEERVIPRAEEGRTEKNQVDHDQVRAPDPPASTAPR